MSEPRGYAFALVIDWLTARILGPELEIDAPDAFLCRVASKSQGVIHLLIEVDLGVFEDCRQQVARLMGAFIRTVGRVRGMTRSSLEETSDEIELPLPADMWSTISPVVDA